MEIKIRRLTVKDRKIFTGLLRKLIDKTGDKEITNIIKSGGGGGSTSEDEIKSFTIEIAIKLFNSLIEILNEETTEWFADLVGVKKEEFDNLPLHTEIEIVKQIIESEDIDHFLSTVFYVYKKIKDMKR